ncbi:MAG: FGGY-family carbohydrate kinase [Ginsengibacter sp.]
MLIMGIDLGTSSVKVSVIDGITKKIVASASYPETESEIISLKPGWAEQNPEKWWTDVKTAILKCNTQKRYTPSDITAIGIAYQMHGLVIIDKNKKVLRNSIIWCDSRAVEIGNAAFEKIGKSKALTNLLNSPGNFTASKLAWVKQNEPELFEQVDKVLLPGDYIAMRLTGKITSSIESLSEGIFWDFKNQTISKDILECYQLKTSFFPEIKNVFSNHGNLLPDISSELGLKKNIPVSYKAGDQPNNALSLNVLNPGEIAATAGTSGVIYGVSDKVTYDNESRVNTFAHVNHSDQQNRLGVLLCINGAGISNRWVRNNIAPELSYEKMNSIAATISRGAEGLRILPFGNGAERMFNNKIVGAHICNFDWNIHTRSHMFRAVQEGVAFAFRYGLDILKENGINPSVIRAGRSNMFLSEVFTSSFVNVTNTAVQLFNCDGSVGAAFGAGIGAGYFSEKQAFEKIRPIKQIDPENIQQYEDFYQDWKLFLNQQLKKDELFSSGL